MAKRIPATVKATEKWRVILSSLIASGRSHPITYIAARNDRGIRALQTHPRFFFHLHNDVSAPDDEGVELLYLEAARMVARHNARFTAAETLKDKGHFIGDHRIDIEDEHSCARHGLFPGRGENRALI